MPDDTIKVQFINETTQIIDTGQLESIAKQEVAGLPSGPRYLVTIRFVGDRTMRSLNKSHLAHDTPTDVLSFPVHHFTRGVPPPNFPKRGVALLGEVVVNLDQAARQADHSGHKIDREVQFVVVHGIKHLLGHHHR